MGRPFASELASLPENISFAHLHPVEELARALDRSKSNRILACGAGGSFSAAAFAQLLFQTIRVEVQAITPLGFLQSGRPSEPTTLLLFTAGGRNKDVLRVIEHARELDVQVLLICATKDSPAAAAAGETHTNVIFDFDYPAGRDGFLAVNSLVVTWWLLARAFGIEPPGGDAAKRASKRACETDYIPEDRRHAILVLHDRWTRPVAVDLESKMAEAALCAPLVCDWRQFGHGRHHWLAKNSDFSSVLALTEPETRPLAARSLRILPKSTPQCVLDTENPGIPGVCDLLLQSLVWIGAVGRRVGIDPGRPGVPPFGSALYHLAPARTRRARVVDRWAIDRAAERKIDAMGLTDSAPAAEIVRKAALRYSDRIRQATYGAIVLDFDGTAAASGQMPDKSLPPAIATTLVRLLRKRVVLGIATGRGDSCHQNLQTAIPEPLWSHVFVCHYNGASIGNLRDLAKKPIGWPNEPVLVEIADELNSDPFVTSLADIKMKGPQITIRAKARADAPLVERIIRTLLVQRHGETVRLVASSHTLDIVPRTATKVALIEHIRKHHAGGAEVLAVGDRGDLCGNDFELLSTPFSLSVDRVSTALDSCWNFLPAGVSHQTGTAHYLEKIRLKEGRFQFYPT